MLKLHRYYSILQLDEVQMIVRNRALSVRVACPKDLVEMRLMYLKYPKYAVSPLVLTNLDINQRFKTYNYSKYRKNYKTDFIIFCYPFTF
jgi:hypothetical protein